MNKLSQKISSLSKNKEAKTLAGNFMWLSALQVAGYVFPLITMPYLARDFGFKPHTPLREGLRRFAEWYKEFYG